MKSFNQFLKTKSQLNTNEGILDSIERLNKRFFKPKVYKFNQPSPQTPTQLQPKPSTQLQTPTQIKPSTQIQPSQQSDVSDEDIINTLKNTPFLDTPDTHDQPSTHMNKVPSFADFNYYWIEYFGKKFGALNTWNKMNDNVKIKNYNKLKALVEKGKRSKYFQPLQTNTSISDHYLLNFKNWLNLT